MSTEDMPASFIMLLLSCQVHQTIPEPNRAKQRAGVRCWLPVNYFEENRFIVRSFQRKKIWPACHQHRGP